MSKKFKVPQTAGRVYWEVIEIFEDEVPKKLLKALELEAKSDGYVHKLMFNDLFMYHGEDGWVLSDSSLDTGEKWLDKLAANFGLRPHQVFWFRIKRA